MPYISEADMYGRGGGVAAFSYVGYQGSCSAYSGGSEPDPRVSYAVYKHMWAAGDQKEALTHLEAFTDGLAARVIGGAIRSSSPPRDGSSDTVRGGGYYGGGGYNGGYCGGYGYGGGPVDARLRCVLVRCLRLCSQWKLELLERAGGEAVAAALPEADRRVIQRWLQTATELEPANYKAWHAWALFNYRLAEDLDAQRQVTAAARLAAVANAAVESAVAGGAKVGSGGGEPAVDAEIGDGGGGSLERTNAATVPWIITGVEIDGVTTSTGGVPASAGFGPGGGGSAPAPIPAPPPPTPPPPVLEEAAGSVEAPTVLSPRPGGVYYGSAGAR
ncbi:unnamed protein product, partial [Phaeothamnion confervicola]